MGRYSGRSSRLILMCVVSLVLFAIEISVAYLGNSLSLTSDAFAVLSHFISMIIGLVGVRVSHIRWHKASTYGFYRADVLGAFGNSVFATALMLSMFIEAIKRYINPQKTEKALLVLVIGIVGLFFNVLNYVIFMDCCYCHEPQGDTETVLVLSYMLVLRRPMFFSVCRTYTQHSVSSLNAGDSPNDQKQPEERSERKMEKKSEALNIRGVLLHVMGDALGSVVVVVAAAIFHLLPLSADAPCNWQCYIDPSLTIVMVIIILSSAFPLIKETSIILLQMVPKGVNMQLLTDSLAHVPGVISLHEVHVWELAGGKNIATLHVKCQTPTDYQDAAYKIRKLFHEAGIHSVTIQPEYLEHKSSTLLCSSPCISRECDPQLCCSQQEASLPKSNGCVEKRKRCLPAPPKDNGASKNDVEIPIECPVSEDSINNVKKCTMSDKKSQLSSTRF
ncbi:PREDICTED: zinc transporter 10 [Tinamus guttatus]|uniref:zinc transporter 10 n=1 Tax=Tinamus guttatus TaxID=94827 RepID=UPI00052E9F2B|nr:PREDICTED: zinc transporter 10 [Tinamus guttatus]